MRLTPRAATVLLLAASAVGAAPDSAPSSADSVTMKPVKYADLVRTVRDLQGKVVVVDFWMHT
jgi:hypothetical protein